MIGTPRQRAARQLWLAERHLRRAARLMAGAGGAGEARGLSVHADEITAWADRLDREATPPRSL